MSDLPDYKGALRPLHFLWQHPLISNRTKALLAADFTACCLCVISLEARHNTQEEQQ
jgi:hypothetical protein